MSLDVPATKPAQVEHLLAPSVRSISGVTLAGQTLGQTADGSARATSSVSHPRRTTIQSPSRPTAPHFSPWMSRVRVACDAVGFMFDISL